MGIVFEDDFEFLVSRETFLTKLEQLFKQVENDGFDFKIVMLAYNANNRFENANNNYGEYHKLKQQNDAWIEWYNTQRKLFEDVK